MRSPAVLRALAPGKVNLCLYLGAPRPGGRHELVSLVESLSLADELELRPAAAGADRDEVVCAGVGGENLALAALVAYRRATGWTARPQRLEIRKRVPVAAGMGGGSGDAAGALRLAAHAAGRPDLGELPALAAELGADVPSQLVPGLVLMTGGGERVEPAPPRAAHAVLIVPGREPLSTAAVYREADRLGLPRDPDDLAARHRALREALGAGDALPGELVVNDLEPAARSLFPAIDPALAAARAAGAEHALVSGSGPTVFGVFAGEAALARAEAAAGDLAPRFPGARAAVPVGAAFGAVHEG